MDGIQSLIKQAKQSGANAYSNSFNGGGLVVPKNPVDNIEPPLPFGNESLANDAQNNQASLISPDPEAKQQQQPKRFNTVGEYLNSIQNEGDRYEEKRKLTDDHRRNLEQQVFDNASRYFPSGSQEQKNYVELQLKKIDKTVPAIKPISETEKFKAAEKYVDNSYRQTLFSLGNLHNQLIEAKKIKDVDERARFLQANIPKVLNSMATGSSDALQEAERFLLIPELKSLFMTGAPWDFKSKIELIQQRGLWGSMFKDPDAFIKKAETIYNAAANKSNSTYNYYYPSLGKSVEGTGLMLLREITPKSTAIDIRNVRSAIKGATGQDPEEVMNKFGAIVPPMGYSNPQRETEAPKSQFGTARPTGVSLFPVQQDYTGKDKF